MRRSLGIFLWILVGALASGIGIGVVLHASNTDRQRLVHELRESQTSLASLQTQHTALVKEQSIRLDAAAQRVISLEQQLRSMTELQSRFKTARVLSPPSAAYTRRWSEFASVAMGVSLRVPPGMQAQSSDDGLFVSAKRFVQGTPIEEQWFALTPYRTEREQDILSRLNNTKPVRYALGTRLLDGVRGTITEGGQTIYVMSVQENASTTHLLWGKTVGGVTEQTVLDTIATLSFR